MKIQFQKTPINKMTLFSIFIFSSLMLILIVVNTNTLAVGGGNAIAANLLSGKTATVDSGSITGTMPNKVGSATVITPSASDQAIPIGYYGGVVGDGKVAGLSFPAGNVLTGTTIAGQDGTMPNNGAIVITPNASTQYIPAGYHNGSGYVTATAPKAFTAGNNEIGSLYTSLGGGPLSTTSTTPVKKASYLLNMGGVYRTVVSTVPQNSGDTNYLRIYKNGVPYGTTRANTYPSYAAYTEDLSFNAGDTLEYWLWSSNGNAAYIQLLGANASYVGVAEAPVVTNYP